MSRITRHCKPSIESDAMRHSRISNHYGTLRDWLKSKRLEANLSIRDLADKLGVHHSIVGKFEDGTRKLEVFEFVEYCRALGVDPHAGLDIMIQSLERKPF